MLRTVLLAMPSAKEFSEVRLAVEAAVLQTATRLKRSVSLVSAEKGSRMELWSVEHLVSGACLVADLSIERRGPSYSLGFADALRLPRVVIADVAGRYTGAERGRTIWYDLSNVERFESELRDALIAVDADQSGFVAGSAEDKDTPRPSAFISYSHVDRACVERLRVHLKPIERQGRLQVWDDSLLLAGTEWRTAIEQALSDARIAILVISPDFLASDFITTNELPRLLERAEKQGTVVLPLILRPSRFRREPRLCRYQAVNDPKQPLLKLDPVQQDEVYEQLAERIERELGVRSDEA
jgi:hypothetical protein